MGIKDEENIYWKPSLCSASCKEAKGLSLCFVEVHSLMRGPHYVNTLLISVISITITITMCTSYRDRIEEGVNNCLVW